MAALKFRSAPTAAASCKMISASLLTFETFRHEKYFCLLIGDSYCSNLLSACLFDVGGLEDIKKVHVANQVRVVTA